MLRLVPGDKRTKLGPLAPVRPATGVGPAPAAAASGTPIPVAPVPGGPASSAGISTGTIATGGKSNWHSTIISIVSAGIFVGFIVPAWMRKGMRMEKRLPAMLHSSSKLPS